MDKVEIYEGERPKYFKRNFKKRGILIMNFQNRRFFHGDNLQFLRGIDSNTIDLIATDPPFNKGKVSMPPLNRYRLAHPYKQIRTTTRLGVLAWTMIFASILTRARRGLMAGWSWRCRTNG